MLIWISIFFHVDDTRLLHYENKAESSNELFNPSHAPVNAMLNKKMARTVLDHPEPTISITSRQPMLSQCSSVLAVPKIKNNFSTSLLPQLACIDNATQLGSKYRSEGS